MSDPLTFVATIEAWTEKAKRNLDLVVRGSTQDVFELATRRQASVKQTGGLYKEGFVPVDTGELIASQRLEINGAQVAQGAAAYEAVIFGMKAGDVSTLAFTAAHARPIEYGTSKFGGRFFIRNAVQQWQRIVEQNAAQFRDD